MLNVITLVGRLSKDPELRNTNSGKPITSFTIAVNSPMKKEDGTKDTTFIDVVCFNQTAENVCKYVRKGNLVGVVGSINQRRFVRQDGSKGSVIEVLADSIQFLEPKEKEVEEVATPEDLAQGSEAPVEAPKEKAKSSPKDVVIPEGYHMGKDGNLYKDKK